ncbi:hypothetical protein [Dictyobacter kobayashii]|uniref:Uncharacterized protein n=1 Tax=Dictyobacter kobayashii TaxID=2014872 RepID=A0A402ARG0_9CHLR|nr:hypothetical protein [Dictyobacter kobayashii]GCE21690.1 hypothetical protein KDK_54900 [Dictyobacter kobayashii]
MHDNQQKAQKAPINKQYQLLDAISKAMINKQPCAHLVREWQTRYPEEPLTGPEEQNLVAYACAWANHHNLTEAEKEDIDVEMIGADRSMAFLLLHAPDRVEVIALIVLNEPAVHLHAFTAEGWQAVMQRRITANGA